MMKKLLLTLGTIATVASSTVAVVSCSDAKASNPSKTNPPAVHNADPSKTVITDPDLLLSDEASKISDKESTSKNFVRVGGEDLNLIGTDGVVGLNKEGGPDWSHAFAEFRAGDYIDFVFKDASDIKTFSKRVFYDNTLAAQNISAGSAMSSIYFSKFIVKNGEVVSLPEETGKFQSEGTAGAVSIFNLKAVKGNVIRMTFNDIYPTSNLHLDAQIIYLRAFDDVNGDGTIDFKDEQMTPTFCIDGGDMYQNYLQPYSQTKNYWYKGSTVGMHDQSIIDYLTK